MNDANHPVARPDHAPGALEAFVASAEHLPLFSGTAVQLVRSFERPEVTSAELATLIASDAALAVHLLRIVNSPFYGLARRIGTVTDALAVLGIDLVRRTVTAAVLQRPLLAYLHDTTIARAFWRHELVCAALSRHLALQNGADGEFAYMAGLLHDVGRLVMLMRFPEHSDVLLQARHDLDGSDVDEEHALFGFDHAQVGAALLELWGLPQGMVMAAHQHIDPTEPDEAGAASVWRANRIAHEAVDDFDGTAAPEDDGDVEMKPWMEAIGLRPKAYRKMRDEIAALEGD